MIFNKTLIALALASTLSACGSDSSTITTDTKTDGAVVTETTVNGKAIKGVLTNAVVKVYKFVDGSPVALTETELKDANINTDGEGNYTFTVLDYEGPIKVELSPSTDPTNPTTMSCDAPAGCGATAFGDPIDLTAIDPGFKLNAISVVDSNNEGEVKVNVSALTHLASVLIEADESGITADSVTVNSAQIASSFGIKGDITQLEPTVTDNASSVAAEDNEAELRYGLINAGIMSALFSGETSSSGVLSSKLAEVAAKLVEDDGKILPSQDDNEDTFELAFDDIWEGMAAATSTAAAAIAADDTLTAIANLSQLETNLINELTFIENNLDEDGFVKVITDVPTEGDAVAKAKAMVDDVRLFSHLFNDETTNGAGIKTQGDEYVTLLEAAGTMVETEADSFELLAQLSNAFADLSLQYDAGTITKAAATAGISIATYIDGATGTITFEEETATGGILFKVDATSGSEKAQLNVSAEFSEDKKSITLTIDGLVESAGAKFTLNEGSFARVNLDTAASRAAFDDDTYEGKIVSGELELTLSLAQKATDFVPNPVTFEGMVKTKLLPVKERILDERWDWDQQNQQSVISYGRNKLETFVQPEMLTLSGAFTSLEGDLISATLTVNIDDLATYEAPEFKYIGKEVADVVNFTFSEDLNNIVLTEADKTVDNEQIVETRIFTPGDEVGEWTATSSVIAANPDEHYWGTGLERKIITKRFDSGLTEEAIRYTRAYITGEDEASFGVKSVEITPVNHNGNLSTDAYNIRIISSGFKQDDKEYDGTSFATLMDANGNVLTSDGNLHNWNTAWNAGEFASIEEFMEIESYQLIANPLTVSNGAELLSQTITSWWGNIYSLNIEDVGTVKVFFNDEELADIAAGEFTELNPTAYLTQPLIKDVLTVEVSEDANTVSYLIENGLSRKFAFSGAGNGNFTAEITTTDFEAGEEHHTATKTIVSITEDISLNVDKVRLNITESHTAYPTVLNGGSHQIIITPQDNDGDGDADQFIATHGYGDHFNANGELVDEANDVIVFDNSIYEIFNSYDEVHWNEPNFANDVPFNPLTADNALNVFKDIIANESNSPYVWVDDIGRLEVTLSDEDLDSIIANSTTMFDGYNIEADDNNILEDEDTFLDVNAALTLEAILGDYQVKLQLSGERTALEQGAFDLDMSYRLPGADTQRSFTAHYNTEVEGRLTANNTDGVVLVLNEPDEDATGTQELGQILVGPTAIVAATIEDRDGAIFIVYADIDNDGVQEEETL